MGEKRTPPWVNLLPGMLSPAELRHLKEILSDFGSQIPEKYQEERGRLIDDYIDGHKYVSGKTAVIYGEEDLLPHF